MSDPNPTVPRGAADPDATSAATPARPTDRVADPPPAVPGYEVCGHIATGGMGAVYRARHLRLNREVALKVILAWRAGGTDLARFGREAEAMAAARHPHVAEVFDSGECDGRPFLVMELLGETLGKRFGAPLPPRDAAELLRKVSSGVAAAHARGIVHRDLKPSNVMLDAAGEPKVTDFGLAKLDSSPELTDTGAVFGTPAYMAPEQAAGAFVGPAADVWALGVMLYEALTGRNPFKADSVPATLANVSHRTPPNPRALAAVPADLELIALKCLEKEAGDRYPTARELVADLERFERGEPISVRRPRRAERWLKWARRKPAEAAALLLGAAALVLVAFAGTAAWLWRDAARSEGEAVAARGTAETALGREQQATAALGTALEGEKAARAAEARALEAERAAQARLRFQQYARAVDLAHREWHAGNVTRARALLDGCASEFRNWEWKYVHRLCHSEVLTLSPPADPNAPTHVHWLEFDGTGERLLAGHYNWCGVWDARSGKLLAERPGTRLGIRAARFSPNGALVAVASGPFVTFWNPANKDRSVEFQAKQPVTSCAFNGTGTRLLAVTTEAVHLVDPRTGKAVADITVHPVGHIGAVFAPNGQFVTSGGDGTVRVWDEQTGVELRTAVAGAGRLSELAVSADGKRVAAAGERNAIRVWDLATGKLLTAFDRHWSQVTRVEFAPGSGAVASADSSERVFVWTVPDGRQVGEYRGHPLGGASLFSPKRSEYITGDPKGGVRVSPVVPPWSEARAVVLNGATEPTTALARDPSGRFLASGGRDGSVRVWDLDHSPAVRHFGRAGAPVSAVDYSPDGQLVATVGSSGLQVRRTTDGATVQTVPRANGEQLADWVRFSAAGDRILTAHYGSAPCVKVWAVGATQPALVLSEPTVEGLPAGASAVEFAADCSRVAVAWVNGTTVVYDTGTGKRTAVVRHPGGGLNLVAFLRDGATLVTAGTYAVCTWDAETGRAGRTFRDTGPARPGEEGILWTAALDRKNAIVVARTPDNRLTTFDLNAGTTRTAPFALGRDEGRLAFSPDGSRLLSAGPVLRVLDATTHEELLVLDDDPDGHASRVRFSADGTRVIVESNFKCVVWDARPVKPEAAPK